MYGADHTHHLGLAPLILTNGKHPMSRRAPLQPRELGTHLRMGGLVRTLMGGMGRKEESIFSNRRLKQSRDGHGVLPRGWRRVNITEGKVGGVPNGTRQCRSADGTKNSKANGVFPTLVCLLS